MFQILLNSRLARFEERGEMRGKGERHGSRNDMMHTIPPRAALLVALWGGSANKIAKMAAGPGLEWCINSESIQRRDVEAANGKLVRTKSRRWQSERGAVSLKKNNKKNQTKSAALLPQESSAQRLPLLKRPWTPSRLASSHLSSLGLTCSNATDFQNPGGLRRGWRRPWGVHPACLGSPPTHLHPPTPTSQLRPRLPSLGSTEILRSDPGPALPLFSYSVFPD